MQNCPIKRVMEQLIAVEYDCEHCTSELCGSKPISKIECSVAPKNDEERNCEGCFHSDVCHSYVMHKALVDAGKADEGDLPVCRFFADKDRTYTLPVRINDNVYAVLSVLGKGYQVVKCRVAKIMHHTRVSIELTLQTEYNSFFTASLCHINKKLFFTPEEAEVYRKRIAENESKS